MTALGAEVLVAEKEGIRSCVWLVWRRAAVPACTLSGSARSCSHTDSPTGQNASRRPLLLLLLHCLSSQKT